MTCDHVTFREKWLFRNCEWIILFTFVLFFKHKEYWVLKQQFKKFYFVATFYFLNVVDMNPREDCRCCHIRFGMLYGEIKRNKISASPLTFLLSSFFSTSWTFSPFKFSRVLLESGQINLFSVLTVKKIFIANQKTKTYWNFFPFFQAFDKAK